MPSWHFWASWHFQRNAKYIQSSLARDALCITYWIIQHPVKTFTQLRPSSQDSAEEKGTSSNPDIPGSCCVHSYSLIWEQLSGPANPQPPEMDKEVEVWCVWGALIPPTNFPRSWNWPSTETPVAVRTEAELQGIATACPGSKNRSHLSDGLVR